MELVRKIGLWIVALVIAIGVGVFYFMVVTKMGAKVDEDIKKLEDRRDKLKVWADKPDAIPNPEWKKAAQVWAERVNQELDNCALYLAVQPLDSYRRSFYRGERVGVDRLLYNEIDHDLGTAETGHEWLRAYESHCKILQDKILENPGAAFTIQRDTWTTTLPDEEEITHAMEMFWVQKEMADRLSDLVERDLNEMLSSNRDANIFPAKASDLVIARGESELDVPLRGVDEAKLLQVAEAILLNDEEIDLATIFDKYLSDPDDQKDFSWARVYSLTTNEEQKRFLAGLVADANDYFNRQRLVDYVMELRSVRYCTDVADLLERDKTEGFAQVGAQLRNMTDNDRIRLKDKMKDWGRTRLAQTIAAVVAIRNEDDYKIVRDNHDPKLVAVDDLQISHPGGATSGGAGAPPAAGRPMLGRNRPGAPSQETSATQSNNYLAWPVKMHVRIEFERIPILMRRLLASSMRFRFSIVNVVPSTRGSSGGGTGIRMSSGASGPLMGGAPPSSRLPGASAVRPGSTVPARSTVKTTDGEPTVQPNYVTVYLEGEGYQFTPLRKKLQDQIDGKPGDKPASSASPRNASRAPGR